MNTDRAEGVLVDTVHHDNGWAPYSKCAIALGICPLTRIDTESTIRCNTPCQGV
jgi:hypothetical protein